MRIFVPIALAFFVLCSAAQAQSGCNGQALSGYICGNPSASTGLPGLVSGTSLFDKTFGSTPGTVLNRTTGWGTTSQPTLGANGGTGGAITLNGATSGSVTIGAKAAAGTSTIFNLPATNGSLNNVLITDGAGNTSWVSAGGGTVSSVGLSMPGIFTVTNSPVTSTGTLTATLNTQSANLIWAGPSTGAASAPTFRSLVGADLPNPSASTLGGVQSFAAVTSQWIRQISTGGVPTASQPAFSDISGVAASTQLPNPTATTLGGIESYVAVSNQWINTISTSGVPSSSQPGFSNLSGQASLAQLPGIGSNTVLSNITGGTSTPLANSLSSIIDNSMGSAQGDVLYRNASGWVVLAPGAGGQVFTTGGAAANPTWTSVTGTGTVTSIATNNGITGGTITSSGTIALANITTGNVMANVSGGTTYPTPTIPSAVLDVIGSTQGSVLYRGASTWLALTPGSNGQYLQTTGVGSTPQWASAVNSINGGTGATTGVDTNTLNTQTANYTIASSDCGKTVQAGTGSTGQFTVTLPAVSGFDTKCQVAVINGDTARGKILSGFPTTMLSSSMLWPGQIVRLKIVNGAWVADNPGRYKASTPIIHVDASLGNNANDGFATGAGAVQTAQQAWLNLAYLMDTQGTSGIIAMACSETHTAQLAMGGTPLGSNLVQLNPDGNCGFSWSNSGPCISIGDLAELNLDLNYYGSSGTVQFTCNTANAASTAQVYLHNQVVLDQEGTPTWVPQGANDNYLMCDGPCEYTIANGMTQSGGGTGNYWILMNEGGKGTQSGVISGSGVFNGIYYLFGPTMLILGTAPAPSGWSSLGATKVFGHATLVNNGLSIPGGTSVGTSGVNCSSLSASC